MENGKLKVFPSTDGRQVLSFLVTCIMTVHLMKVSPWSKGNSYGTISGHGRSPGGAVAPGKAYCIVFDLEIQSLITSSRNEISRARAGAM